MNLPQPEWQKPQMFYGKPLTFNPRNHRYTWDGRPVPSVTTIIGRLNKPLLVQWAANMAVDHIARIYEQEGELFLHTFNEVCQEARKAHVTKKDSAADIGSRVHEYAQMVLQGQTPPEPLDGPAQKGIEAFWRWVEQHKIEPIAVERRVMSKKYMYAGTCDFFGLIDDQPAVLDFKTGRGVYDEAWWQTVGYELALTEELDGLQGQTPLQRWIVHLNKETGECATYLRCSADDYTFDMAVWRSLVGLDYALRTARKHPQPKKAA